MKINSVNTVSLGEVLKYEQPTKYIVDNTNYDDEFDIPVLTAGKSFLLGYTNETHNVFSNVPVIIFDDFTTAFKYVDFPFKVKSSAMKILKANKEIADIRFLYYRMMKTGIDTELHKRYWISKYSKVKIPLPPLDKQKKIASILDAADAYRQKTKALIIKYDELTQSLFLDMFGDPVTNPKGWETKPLSGFIKSLNTGVSVNSTDKEFKKGDIGILKTSCVYTGIFRAEEAKVIREDEYERMKLNPTADSIIISRMNTSELVGKSAYISKDCNELYLPDRLWQSVKGELHHNVRWLSHAVSFQSFMNEISKISSGTSGSMKNISKKNYLNLKMIYPTLELQNQFAERVQAIEAQKAQAQESLAKAEDLFNSLLQKAFKGELN
jgi:type I restriction enzyme, S subunit